MLVCTNIQVDESKYCVDRPTKVGPKFPTAHPICCKLCHASADLATCIAHIHRNNLYTETGGEVKDSGGAGEKEKLNDLLLWKG